jgi:hypothetical protein
MAYPDHEIRPLIEGDILASAFCHPLLEVKAPLFSEEFFAHRSLSIPLTPPFEKVRRGYSWIQRDMHSTPYFFRICPKASTFVLFVMSVIHNYTPVGAAIEKDDCKFGMSQRPEEF